MPGMSTSEALKEYGYVGTLANSVPELKRLLSRAAANGWTVEEFTRALQDTPWWRNSADAVKQYQVLKSTKPGEFDAQRGELVNKVRRYGAEMGVGLGEGHGSMLGWIVDHAQRFGWDEATIRQNIGHQLKGATATFGGTAGTIQQQVKKLYGDYGVRYGSYRVNLWTRSILEGSASLEKLRAELMVGAKSRYAAIAGDIDQGRTVREIADPYIQLMASTWERPEGTIDLYDTKVQQALSRRDPKSGQPVLTPLWQFERELKDDPRWDTTKNAVNTAYDQAMRIGKAWGFET
jgi:hypothetical protein